MFVVYITETNKNKNTMEKKEIRSMFGTDSIARKYYVADNDFGGVAVSHYCIRGGEGRNELDWFEVF